MCVVPGEPFRPARQPASAHGAMEFMDIAEKILRGWAPAG
jgi:hypothetical protein